MVTRWFWPVAVWGSVMVAPAPVPAETLPPPLRAVLLLKVLNYDRNVAKRTADNAVVGVWSLPTDADADCAALVAAISETAKSVTVAGKPVSVVSFKLASAAEVAERLTKDPVAGLYVCPSTEPQVASIAMVTRRMQVLSVAGSDGPVRTGLGLALVLRDKKPTIVVNLAAVRAEGANLDSALLRIAEVIK